jgi:uncharacterized protein involved in cysteine biosynthesis
MKILSLTVPGANGAPVDISGAGGMPQGGASSLNSIITTGLNLAVLAAIFVCLLMLIIGGFEWIFSQGDKQKLNQARQRLAMSILGLVIIFLSFLAINVIYMFFFGKAVNFLGSQ